MYPFMDLSSLSDDKLLENIQKCQNMLTYEMGMGHTSMASSIRMQLDAYQFELQERMATKKKKAQDEKNPKPNVIDIGSIEGEYYYPDDKEDKS